MTNNRASLAIRPWAIQGHCLEPMLFRKSRRELFPYPELSPADVEAIEEIRSLWQRVMNGMLSNREVIDLALRNLQRDLRSSRSCEVVQDLKREIAYRHWCAANISSEPFPEEPEPAVRPFPRDGSSA